MNNHEINTYIKENFEKEDDRQIAGVCGITPNAVEHRRRSLGLKRPKVANGGGKQGVEIRQDGLIVINWDNKTIITDLGEFGSFVCGFSMHGAIQRAYVTSYEGKGDTAAEVATRFSFAHAKAVWKYAKIHGFTKSSLGQTDLEFEMGMTAEEAAKENIQSLKRRAIKITEQKKWQKTQADSDKWNQFEHSIFYPLKDWIDVNLPKYKPPVFKGGVRKGNFAAVIGVSDWHYMKLAFSHDGREVYNREIALERLREANNALIKDIMMYGVPDKIYVPVGTDNLHIDNPQQMTTKGTPQAGQTDGDWHAELDNYLEAVVKMIELYAQIAPVEVVSMPGNHDKHTSYLMASFLSMFFNKHKRISVSKVLHPRCYITYGNNLFVFDHGDGKSIRKFQGNMHKLVLVEAKDQGINMHNISNIYFFSGHLHFEMSIDLGGIKHHIIPSLSTPDQWHREHLYVGTREQASAYIIDKETGERAVVFS